MNDTMKSIFDRRSIREYSSEPVSPEHTELLKKAALASPTARNAQSWHFSFVSNRELIKRVELESAQVAQENGEPEMAARLRDRGIFYNAPLVVFISSDTASRWGHIDAGIAVENIALAAHSLGLGSVIIGLCAYAFKGAGSAELRKALGFPEGYDYSIAICVGTPTAGKGAHDVQEGKIIDIE